MAQEVIAFWGIRVASVESTKTIRHTFAFDLRDVDFRKRPILSAVLEWPAALARDASGVNLSDPGHRVRYGSARHQGESPVNYVELSRTAIADLQGAAGAFFSVDAEFDDDEPLCLAGWAERRLILFAVAEAASGIAAVAPSAAPARVSAA